ncbi:MAG TPA: xanthine dehydrogenase small subunit [Flavobacteriales bacterium]|nr:xanthine dehydrogenase small subunit [Flavobacteriales bacterium]
MSTNNQITFVLNDELVNLNFSDQFGETPITTVLNYLRSRPGYAGSKEGCAEGDCGACTVVIGSLSDGQISYTAIDACLVFLPMLHGKQLLTVEHLGNSSHLHPVQSAMVETDGSQCGYCTPGFVMSLLALYKNYNNPSREVINDALTGNLCRCTGYRSIAEAAAISCANDGQDQFTARESDTAKLLASIDSSSIYIDTKKHVYFRPESLAETLDIKKEYPNILVINGATDIALRVTKLKEHLPEILDLGNVAELKEVKESEGAIHIGAGVVLEHMKTLVQDQFPALYDMLAVFGSKQIRELATLGGNIGSASPIGDIPPVLMAYNALIVLVGSDGERVIPMREFITGYRKTQQANDEIIKSVTLPLAEDNCKVQSYKISKRKDLDISTVSGGFSVTLGQDGQVTDVCLAYGGMADQIKRAAKTEAALIGKPWNRDSIEAATNLIDEDFKPISDARAEAEGRTVMARNLLMKFWSDTI